MEFCSKVDKRNHEKLINFSRLKSLIFFTILGIGLIISYSVYEAFSVKAKLLNEMDGEVFHSNGQAAFEYPGRLLSLVNLQRSKTLTKVLQPTPRPPGYPLLLWGTRKLHIPLKSLNLLLFYLTLLLIGIYSNQYLPYTHPLTAVLLYLSCAFNYYHLSLFTSEALIIPLSLLLLFSLIRFIKRQSFFNLLLLSSLCAFIFVSRYHALFWLLPIVTAHMIFLGQKTHKKTFFHLISFGTIALAPVGAIMVWNYLNTGFITGVNRFGARTLPDKLAYFAEKTGLEDNISLTIKTYVVDFLSPFKYATHEVNRLPYDISYTEIGIGILLASIIGIVILRIAWHQRRPMHFKEFLGRLQAQYKKPSPNFLLIEFLVGYIFITIIVWTIGNNDPIYSRFMYPSYVYFILSVFAGYSFVKGQSRFNLPIILFLCLYLSVMFINLHKIAFNLRLI